MGKPGDYRTEMAQYAKEDSARMPSGGGGLAVTIIGENPKVTLGAALVVFALP